MIALDKARRYTKQIKTRIYIFHLKKLLKYKFSRIKLRFCFLIESANNIEKFAV